jgi:hypothetical protein
MKLVYALLGAIRDLINISAGQSTTTIASQDACKYQQSEIKINLPNPISVKAEISEPEPIRQNKERTDNRYHRLNLGVQSAIAVGTVGAFLAASYYACITRDTWKEVRKQTEIAQRQLDQSGRTWLTVTLTPAPVTFKDGGVQIGVIPSIKNIGNSVATGVIVPIKVYLASTADDIFKRPLKIQADLCDPLSKQPVNDEQDRTGISILPTVIDSSLFIGRGFSKEELNSAATANPNFPIKHIVPILVGCVDYQFATANRHHQTRFIYEIVRAGKAPNTSIEVGKDIPANEVVLAPYAFGGFATN